MRQLLMLPFTSLSLSREKRLLIVALSYGLGFPGIWLFLPLVHNAASMILPIICICWFFRYRGLLISVALNGIVLWLTSLYLAPYALTPGQTFGDRAIFGLAMGLVFGLTACWLRTAVDLVSAARQQALTAEQERLLATLAYEQQRKINELKDQFLLNVSHELRTPLTVLRGYLELLKEQFESSDSMKQVRMLNQALISQETLTDLVNQMLDATTVESEIPLAKPEVVRLHQLLQEELTHLAPGDVEAYTIYLQVPNHIIVWADPQFLRQVVRNLLSNIFKYVPKQTEISIGASQATPSSPVHLSVQDAGPGIPAEELPLLFEKFVRLKRDLAGSARGTGLGLYICKRFVEAMEGRIWVESSGLPGEGCCFHLTLPSFNNSTV